MSYVQVYNEWDPLEEIIVGIVDNAQFPQYDLSFHATFYEDCAAVDVPSGSIKKKIVEETREDLENLVDVLQKRGVHVRRPKAVDTRKQFSSLHWQTNGFSNYCPRDILLAIGNTIIETPSPVRARYFETHAYKEILMTYFKNGSQWIAAPKPQLLDSMYDLESKKLCLQNHEPAFDAANVLRLGKDLLYLVSNTANEAGYQWLSRIMGEQYTIHPCYDIYNHTHIDTTFIPIGPGQMIVNGSRVHPDNLPAILKSWEIIYFTDIVDIGFFCGGTRGCASEWIGLNFLMINPHLAIVEKKQLPLIKTLEKLGIDIIPLSMRHARSLGGGFHCVTLDTRRKGSLKSYF